MLTSKPLFLIFSIALFFNYALFGQNNVKNLKKTDIQNIRLEYDKSKLRIKGNPIPIGVSVIDSKNLRHTTRGFSKGKIRWSNFKIIADSATFFMGNLHILNAKKIPDKIKVTIIPKYQPDKKITQYITLNQIIDIAAKKIKYDNLAPGGTINFEVDVKYDNDEIFTIKTPDKPKLDKYNLEASVFGGSIKNGKIKITDDPDEIINHTLYYFIWNKLTPYIADTLEIKLDYKKQYSFHAIGFSGISGSNGFSGNNGFSGSTGNNGHNGSDGQTGSNGTDGHNGPDLNVFADSYFDSTLNAQLLYVEINNPQYPKPTKYLINTNGGTIQIYSFGGSGGNGGTGGSGGNGGSGGGGTETIKEWSDSTGYHREIIIGSAGNGGNGGYGGNGGDGGFGGNGGNITINYTSNAKPYLHLIDSNSYAGSGGNSGNGGNGGSGGSGGSGNPNGNNGNSGISGIMGRVGDDGYNGEIYFNEIE